MNVIGNLINIWDSVHSSNSDPYVRFFFFYMCLDAWISGKSQSDNNEKKLKWVLNNDTFKRSWDDILQLPDTVLCLEKLKNLSPVKDTRPSQNNNGCSRIENIESFEEVIRFIYQIRCNLFHGSKNPIDKRDIELVECSGMILEKLIISAYSK